MSPTPGASLHNVAMLDFYIRHGDWEAQVACDAALGNRGGGGSYQCIWKVGRDWTSSSHRRAHSTHISVQLRLELL